MSDIPTHLFLEILRRVPVESLFRFRSVCKAWRRIIDDPAFAKLHIHRATGENSLLIRTNTGKVFLLPLTCLINDTCYGERCCMDQCCGVKLVHATNIKTPLDSRVPNLPVSSCNGMILIWTSTKNWLIWNPFTSESVEVPPLQVQDSCICTYCGRGGLGYDEANDDYKVVWVVDTNTFIYSVNSGNWRRVEDLRFPTCFCEEKYGVFANGALHWIANPEEVSWDLESVCIVSLDLTTETYNVIDLPDEITEYLAVDSVDDQYCSLELVALNGCLFLTFLDSMMDFSVWKMERNADKKIMSFKKSNISLIAYLESQDKALFRYKNDKFLWHDGGKDCLQKVSMEVNPDANGEDKADDSCEYLYDTFTYQVLPSSLARLKKSDDGASDRKARKKRRTVNANERLGLKICYGCPNTLQNISSGEEDLVGNIS